MTTIRINENQVHQTARNLTQQAMDLVEFADTLRPEQEAVSTEEALPTEVNDGYRRELATSQETAQEMLRALARNVEGMACILTNQAQLMGCVIEEEIMRDLCSVHAQLDELNVPDAGLPPDGPIFIVRSGGGATSAL